MTPQGKLKGTPRELDPSNSSGAPSILYIITRAVRGGAQTHLLDLASAMRRDFEVAVATGEEGFLTRACRDRNIRVHILPHLRRPIRPVADVSAFWEICRLIRRLQPDLIHAHTSKAGFLGRLAGHVFGVPAVYTVHGGLFGPAGLSNFGRLLGSPCERIAASWCARLITVCHEGARLAQSWRIKLPSKIVTIHNGIRDNLDRADLSPDHPPVITMVARFCEPKDQSTLLRAFANIPAGPRLRLVGGGPLLESCKKLAGELGIPDRVDFLGDRDDVPSLLAGSDVFVLATKFEMFPISVLEAMRAGLPVIASRVGGIGEVVEHGETGLLVPTGSASALAQALTRVVENFSLRVNLGRAARKRFTESFLLEAQVERTRSLYLEVLAECGRVRWETPGVAAPQATGRVA
jgi:glycosyltransferase involved in cell wall biosynthesis